MTIKEIAKLSNVSISTVSKILNGKDSSISGETREKVLRIARDYHYVPYEKAVSLSRFLIGVVVRDSPKGGCFCRESAGRPGNTGMEFSAASTDRRLRAREKRLRPYAHRE